MEYPKFNGWNTYEGLLFFTSLFRKTLLVLVGIYDRTHALQIFSAHL